MMQSGLAQSALAQKQLYEDLSALILTFKKLASFSESVAICIDKHEDHTGALLKMKCQLEILDPLKDKYQQESIYNQIQGTQELSYRRTFYRFICRLLEVVVFLKGKSQARAVQPHFTILNSCLQQIQTSIRRCKESKELSRLIKIIQMSFVKFGVNCKLPQPVLCDNSGSKCDQMFKLFQEKIIKDKKTVVVGEKSANLKHMLTEMDESSSEESDSKSQKACKKKSNARRNYHFRSQSGKQLVKLQRRFDTLKHLDLDYSYFKSDYFLARGNQPQFYKQFLDKNMLNKRIITRYYDDFFLFLRKKLHKQGRKANRPYCQDRAKLQSSQFNKLEGQNILEDFEEGQECSQTDEATEERKSIIIKNAHISARKLKEADTHSSKPLDYESVTKKQLKMKNIQITLFNMSKEGKKSNTSSNSHTNKSRLQPICVNQAYYNDLEIQAKNSLCFLHRKLKLEADLKKKIKTENEKQATKANTFHEIHNVSDITKPEELYILALKSKSSFKGNYLEINCRNQSKQGTNQGVVKRKLSKERSTMQKITMKNMRNARKRESEGKLVIHNEQ